MTRSRQALSIGSVSLFADSVDFLEGASVNLLILLALGWSVRRRALVGMGLAGLLLVPALATLWTAWNKINVPVPPDPVPLLITAAGALAVNLSCVLMLARHRRGGGSLTRATFLSVRLQPPCFLSASPERSGIGSLVSCQWLHADAGRGCPP